MKGEWQRVGPGFAPLVGETSRVLVLGSFPSPASRAQGFYYGNPHNRFWPLLAALFGAPLPKTQAEKRALVLENGLALWDSVESALIQGASDASLRAVRPSDVAGLAARWGLGHIVCNGAASHRVYMAHVFPQTGLAAVRCPSTSPANAAWSLERLQAAWGEALRQAGLCVRLP